jgi:hypothetical protein
MPIRCRTASKDSPRGGLTHFKLFYRGMRNTADDDTSPPSASINTRSESENSVGCGRSDELPATGQGREGASSALLQPQSLRTPPEQAIPTSFRPVRTAPATQDSIFDREVISIHSRSPSPAEHWASEPRSPFPEESHSDSRSSETTISQRNSVSKRKADTEVDEALGRKKAVIEEQHC